MHDGMPHDPIQGQCHETLKVEIFPFTKFISSGIFNVSWQMTTDSETMEQYLNFVRTRFFISVLVFVSCDYELGTKFRLIGVYLLRKNMEIEVSAFGNFSTDTGSTDCNQVNINVFRFHGESTVSSPARLIFIDCLSNNTCCSWSVNFILCFSDMCTVWLCISYLLVVICSLCVKFSLFTLHAF